MTEGAQRILQLLQVKPHTIPEMANTLAYSEGYLQATIRALRAARQVYVAEWRRTNTVLVAVYAPGDKKDAARLKPRPRKRDRENHKPLPDLGVWQGLIRRKDKA